MPIDALSVLCAQLTRDLLAIAKFLFIIFGTRHQQTFKNQLQVNFLNYLACILCWEVSSPHFLFWDPSISPKLMELGSWDLVHCYAFAGAITPCKNLSARGHLGKSAAPTFYFGTHSISFKLITLGSWNLVCWLAFTDSRATCIFYFC